MWEIVQAGGVLMWPIMLCSVVAAAIVLERLWTLQDRRVLPPDLMQKVWKLVETHQINDKVILALEQNSPLGRLLAAGLQNRHRPREVLMERLEDTGRHMVHELERFLNTLGTIAGVSPLLGLLGTVTGIIKAFNAINAGGAGDPRMLSGGIAEALVATAAGLCVAIPSLIAYRYLRGRVERIVVEMEKNALRLVDAVESAARQPAAPSAPAPTPAPPPAPSITPSAPQAAAPPAPSTQAVAPAPAAPAAPAAPSPAMQRAPAPAAVSKSPAPKAAQA